jgi:hypothetical protein
MATKLVFFDLRDDFVARLYFPTPSECRLSTLLQPDSKLDLALVRVGFKV